jgi:tetratricopeptide (TPR) repeat protein
VHAALRRHEDEAADLQQALRLLGDSVDLLADAARALTAAGRHAEALAMAERAVRLAPDSPDALGARVVALSRLRRWSEAVADYERLSALDPDTVEWRFGIAAALNESGRPAEAVAAFDAALELQPDRAQAIDDRALALASMGRYEEAFAGFARAVELDPALAEAHWHEALYRLLLGQFEIGWRKYEWRWKLAEFLTAGAKPRAPQWTGAEDPAGKAVLLYGEQGLGDVIQFCRYAPLLAGRGARVIVGAHPPLKPLLQTLDGVAQVIGNREPLPPIDFQCPLMSLPLAFGTRVETVPAMVPYLHADPVRRRRWSQRLGPRGRVRVGLAWSGDPRLAHDRRRSLALPILAPLLAVRADFVCLGKLVRDSDAEPMRRFGIRFFGDELSDFAETAALAGLMDLVISVDTAVAHLAGALALPLWLLIPDPPDYRWMLEREDSPWYPTARLFRQRSRGDWPEVVARVARALETFVAEDGRRADTGVR